MKYILFAIGIYLLYQFIFRLVLPVYMATRKIKKGFREMQQKMQEQQQSQTDFQQQPDNNSNPKPQVKAGEYIDFEEVK